MEHMVDEDGYLHCKICGHKWRPRLDRPPVVCPKCKHHNWKKDPWEVEKDVNEKRLHANA